MATPTDDVGLRFRVGLTALLIAIATWGVVDLVLDRPQEWLSVHVLVEIGFVLLSLGSVLYLCGDGCRPGSVWDGQRVGWPQMRSSAIAGGAGRLGSFMVWAQRSTPSSRDGP
jgi:hypothetical protein